MVPASDEDSTYRLVVRDDSLVLQYRFDALLHLGVDAVDAERLVGIPDVAHAIARLIGRGCAAHLAVRIVA